MIIASIKLTLQVQRDVELTLQVQRDGGELDGCAHHRRIWLRRAGPALLDDPPGFNRTYPSE